MNRFLLLMIFFAQLTIVAQQNLKGILLDSVDSKPIEFANIGLIGKNVGTVTNDKGEFNLLVPDSLISEKTKISIIGYKTRIVSTADLVKMSVIKLSRDLTTLAEVEVRPKKTKNKILGNETKTNGVRGGFKRNSLGSEMAIKLNIKHKDTQLRKFMININANTIGLPVFRFNVYSVGKDGMPNENLLKQNILIEPKNPLGLVELDLVPFDIILNEDVFISMEWIKDLGDAKAITFSTKLVGNSTYFRQTSQGKWEKISPIGIGLFVEVAY